MNGRAGISPDMAPRLSKAFGRSPERWLALQSRYDLWRAARRARRMKVKRFPAPSPA